MKKNKYVNKYKNFPEDLLEMDNYCGFNEVKKKNIILPIGETLKYLENSYDNIASPWNSKNTLIDIDRQKNTTMLDILNYHTFMNVKKSNDDLVSKSINLFIKCNFLVIHIYFIDKCK